MPNAPMSGTEVRSTKVSAPLACWAFLYKSSGVRPVCFAIRASIFGPIS